MPKLKGKPKEQQKRGKGKKDRVRSVIRLLNQTTDYIDVVILKYLKVNDKELQHVLNYYISNKEYRLRALLVRLSCEACKGNFSKIKEAAVAMELLHLSTLVLDDILDNSDLRYGKKSLHKKFGLSKAIITAELLKSIGTKALLSVSRNVDIKKVYSALDVYENMFRTVYYGQYLDLFYLKNKNVDEKTYVDRTYKITASQMEACMRIGAILGGGIRKQVDGLSRFGNFFGMAFQIYDDIEDVTHDTRKSFYNDIKEGKMTLIIIHALSKSENKEKAKLLKVLGNRNVTERDLDCVVSLLEKTKSIKYTHKVARKFIDKSIRSTKNMPRSEAKESLIDLAKSINEF